MGVKTKSDHHPRLTASELGGLWTAYMNNSMAGCELTSYAQAGAKIMIDNGWMEEPPQAADRSKLSRA